MAKKPTTAKLMPPAPGKKPQPGFNPIAAAFSNMPKPKTIEKKTVKAPVKGGKPKLPKGLK